MNKSVGARVLTVEDAIPGLLDFESRRVHRGDLSLKALEILTYRLRRYVVPHFGNLHLDAIEYKTICEWTNQLQQMSLKMSTIKQLQQVLKKLLKWALLHGHLTRVPPFPELKASSTPRGAFSVAEVLALWRGASRLELKPGTGKIELPGQKESRIFSRRIPLRPEFKLIIPWMINTFIRPSDLKTIRLRHVEVVNGPIRYLRLRIPQTKRHAGVVISLAPAIWVFQALKREGVARGYGRPDDHLFFPDIQNRNSLIMAIDNQFRRLLDECGLRYGSREQVRTLYSLRHSAIMFRLLYGGGIDLLTLAKNARTSVEMIEKFYASELTAEMNVSLLHSKRRRTTHG